MIVEDCEKSPIYNAVQQKMLGRNCLFNSPYAASAMLCCGVLGLLVTEDGIVLNGKQCMVDTPAINGAMADLAWLASPPCRVSHALPTDCRPNGELALRHCATPC